MKLTELLARSGLPAGPVSPDPEILGLAADSRQVEPGFLFVALPGLKEDGRRFIADAAVRGAVAVLAGPDTQIPHGIAALPHENPRQLLARLAAAFYEPLPRTLVAVTGTNGKTSTVNFAAQIWNACNLKAASLGTIGIVGPGVDREGSLTTPDPVTLARNLGELARHGITHCALEASSHGLDQFRLDGLTLTAAGFTYLGRDHLDYHQTPDNYFAAKSQLFSRLLPAGATAVLNADIPEFRQLRALCHERKQQILSYGSAASADLRLTGLTPQPDGLLLEISVQGAVHKARIRVTGRFQAGNILCALGLALASGTPTTQAVAALSGLRSVRGRMELAAESGGRAVYVDYAHTPDALETVLSALRAHTPGRLVAVFGCGGNRDRGKRPLMGEIAARLADTVIVTDDNPRHEDPAAIRAEILNACPDGQEVAERAKAIQLAVHSLQPGDTLIIAGKGHEQGQIVGNDIRPFDDATEARRALKETLLS